MKRSGSRPDVSRRSRSLCGGLLNRITAEGSLSRHHSNERLSRLAIEMTATRLRLAQNEQDRGFKSSRLRLRARRRRSFKIGFVLPIFARDSCVRFGWTGFLEHRIRTAHVALCRTSPFNAIVSPFSIKLAIVPTIAHRASST